MWPLRYSINVTLDGCCDHRVIPADEERHRPIAQRPAWSPPFARTIDDDEFSLHPPLAGHGPPVLAGLSKHVELTLYASGAVAIRYEAGNGSMTR